MQKFCFWWNENRSARSKFHCIGIGFKAIIKGRNPQHLIRVMKVEVLWWLSGRAPAPLGIVNWPLNTGWRFFFSLHVRESGNLLLLESGILKVILLMESGILSFGIRNTAHDWNPESKFYWQILESSTSVESGIHSVESRIQDWNPESGNFLLVESGILEVIFLMESGILTFGIRNTAEGIRNPLESTAWNAES